MDFTLKDKKTVFLLSKKTREFLTLVIWKLSNVFYYSLFCLFPQSGEYVFRKQAPWSQGAKR